MASTFESLPPPQLSWLDQTWADLFKDRNQLIVLAAISFIVHEIVYFGRYIPFMIASRIRYFDKYKLQADKQISDEQWWKCVKGVLIGQWCIDLPLMIFFHPTAQLIGMKVDTVPLPSWYDIAYQNVIFLVVEDAFHYWAHRALHTFPKLYKIVHKQHHEFAAPFGLAAEYAHPYEVLILSMGTFIGPLMYCLYTGGEFHVFTMLVWSVVRTFQAVDAHSGYDFPWSLHNILPFWSGAEHHDYHHQAFVGNYSTSFRWWDYFCGTDKNYRAYRQRQEEEKRSQKAVKSDGAKQGTKEE